MRLFRLLGIASLLFAFAVANAQYVTFSASHLVGTDGAPVADGSKLCAITVDTKDVPKGYRVGTGSGQVVSSATTPACRTVTSGAITPFQIIDSSLSYPGGACIRITIVSPTGSEQRRDKCVQTTSSGSSSWCTNVGGSTTCDFDHYPPGGEAISINIPPAAVDPTARSAAAAAQATANSALSAAGTAQSAADAAQGTATSAQTAAATAQSTANAAQTAANAAQSTADAATTALAGKAASTAATTVNGKACQLGAGCTLTLDDIPAGFSITSFTCASCVTVEIGATVTNPAFAAAYSSTPSSVTITNTDGISSPTTLTSPFTSATVTGTFTKSTSATTTFTLRPMAGSNPTATRSITWVPRVFGGVGAAGATSSVAASGTSAVLSNGATLSSLGLTSSSVGATYGPFCPINQKIYLLIVGGSHTFKDASTGFSFSFNSPTTVTLVNANGAPVAMSLYETSALLNGCYSILTAS